MEKGPGDKVIAASLNKAGSFTFRAQKVGEDTTLAQIIALVQDAAASKAPIAKPVSYTHLPPLCSSA